MATKKLLVFSIIFILTFQIVLAVDVEIKDSVKLGENFIVKVSGVFKNDIQESQIIFHRANSPSEFGEINIIDIAGDYYFYLEIPLEKVPGNYTMTIKDAKYMSGREIVTEDIVTKFEIENSRVPFSITPPLVIATGEYNVDVQNLLDHSITIDLEMKVQPVIENLSESENETMDENLNETINEETKNSLWSEFFDILFGRKNKEELNETTVNESESNETSSENNETPITGGIITGYAITEDSITLKSGEIKTLTFEAPKNENFEKLELYYGPEAYAALIYNPNPEEEFEEIETIEDDLELTNASNETSNELTNESLEEELNYTGLEETELGEIINKSTNETICTIHQLCSECGGKNVLIKKKSVLEIKLKQAMDIVV